MAWQGPFGLREQTSVSSSARPVSEAIRSCQHILAHDFPRILRHFADRRGLRSALKVAREYAGQRMKNACDQRTTSGITWVIEDHLRPSGHIMPDHAGDRGAVLLVLAPHDHLHINHVRACAPGPRVLSRIHRRLSKGWQSRSAGGLSACGRARQRAYRGTSRITGITRSVFCSYCAKRGAAVVICCQASSRSGPWSCLAVTGIVRPSTSIWTSSGCAAML